jgi:hypothetical protein
MEAEGYQWAIWNAGEQFSLEEYRAFTERWHPEIQDGLRRIGDVEPGTARLAALKVLQERLERYALVVSRLPQRAALDVEAERARLDRLRFRALRAGPVRDLDRLLQAAKSMETQKYLHRTLLFIARELAAVELPREERARIARVMAADESIREATEYFPAFWKRVRDVFPLPEPVEGEVVDLTDAHEVRVNWSWDLLRAKRVGPVVPERTALVVYTDRGAVRFYVRGERKLKFQIARAGGTLQKFGCTLRMRLENRGTIQPLLLEAERLRTLANVAPREAVESIRDLNLPPDHLVYRTAAAAERDPGQAQLLSDLLIELRFGIDASVARARIREQSRSGGR